MRKTLLFFVAAIAWFITSVILLTLPGSSFPSEDWFDKIWLDKWIHIGMFSIMVWLWCGSWHLLKINKLAYAFRRAFIIIALIFVAYGIGMEFVQKYWIPNRSFDVGDIAADAIGCTIGSIFSMRVYIKK